MKKFVRITALVLSLLLVTAAAGIFALWHNELASVASFRQIRARNDAHMDGAVYELTVKGGYYLEDFVAQGGVSSDSELISFVVDHITKGLIPRAHRQPGDRLLLLHGADRGRGQALRPQL